MKRRGLFFAGLLAASVLTAQEVPRLSASVAQGRLEVAFTIPPGLHQSQQHPYFGVAVDQKSLPVGATVGAEAFPPTDKTLLGLPAYDGTVVVSVPLNLPTDGQPFTLRAQARWQLCYDDGVCLLPDKADFTLAVNPTPGLGWVALPAAVTLAEAAAGAFDLGAGEPAAAGPPPAEQTPLVLVLLLAFLGGILLNFMPCVLPVLSIKVVSLVKQAGQDRRVRWHHAWAASAGIVSSLLLLAGVLVGLQAAGAAVGWGVQFQNPWYVVGLIVLVLVFALSLFDVFQLSSPAVRQGRRTGLVGSFFSGLLTVVLATPCTAPFLGTALGVAFASPWWVIVLVFAAVGVGLALPFFLVTVVPGALERLPTPGAWMDTFRGLMGFALVGTAIWLLGVLLAQTSTRAFSAALWFLGLVLVVAWLGGQLQRRSWAPWRRRVAGGALAAALAVGAWGLLDFSTPASAGGAVASLPAPWELFTEARVAERTSAGRPVFVDFTAEWCLTCQVNEAGALADAAVLAAFERRGVSLLRGDYTNADPVIAAWLKKHGRAGVPFYALLVPGRDPVLFPEVLTQDDLVRALASL